MSTRTRGVSAPSLGMARALPLLFVLAFALTAGGCAASGRAHPSYGSAGAATAEFRAEGATLLLPRGWAWPTEPIPATYRGDDIRYEKGYGTQAADQYWFCSWAVEALRASPGSAARTSAVREMAKLTESYYFEVLNPQSKPYVLKELRRARRGRLDLVRTDVELNCPQHS